MLFVLVALRRLMMRRVPATDEDHEVQANPETADPSLPILCIVLTVIRPDQRSVHFDLTGRCQRHAMLSLVGAASVESNPISMGLTVLTRDSRSRRLSVITVRRSVFRSLSANKQKDPSKQEAIVKGSAKNLPQSAPLIETPILPTCGHVLQRRPVDRQQSQSPFDRVSGSNRSGPWGLRKQGLGGVVAAASGIGKAEVLEVDAWACLSVLPLKARHL